MPDSDITPKQTIQALREACEDCHQRKVRCVARNGPCDNCVSNGRDCVFRQRSAMGRPRKSKSGQQHNPRSRLAASRKLSMTNVNNGQTTTEPQETPPGIAPSVGPQQPTPQQPPTNQSDLFPPTTLSNNEADPPTISSSAQPPSYTFSQMAASYPMNLPDVEFDMLFDSSIGNVQDCETFDHVLGYKNNLDSNNHNFGSIISISSTILFELRRLCDRLIFMDVSEVPTDLSDVLKNVSSFCGLMLPKVSTSVLATQRWEETQTVAQLVVMAISTAMKCYSMLAQRHKDIASCTLQSNPILGVPLDQQQPLSLTPNLASAIHIDGSSAVPVPHNISAFPDHTNNHISSSHSSMSSSSSNSAEGGMIGNIMAWATTATSSSASTKIPTFGPAPIGIVPDLVQLKQRLSIVIQFTVMDYHIAQFQWILAHLVEALGRLAVAGFRDFPLDELARLQKEAIELRERFQSLTKEVRESYFA